MRDRRFTERLMEIKAKYGYAQDEPAPKALVKPQYQRCCTPTMYNNYEPQQTDYTSQRIKMNWANQPPKSPRRQIQKRKQVPEEKYFPQFHQDQSPIIDLTKLSSSPIKRYEGTFGCPSSARNPISPKNLSKMLSPLKKDNSYQSKRIQTFSRNVVNNENPKTFKENQVLKERSFYEPYKTPNKEDEVKSKQYQMSAKEQSFTGRSCQKRSVLDQCNFNIQSIDKIQDRIANALRKNK